MARGRILFADNDPDFLGARTQFLSQDYIVIHAGTVEDAEQALRQEWLHLAILDIRLSNDGDERDVSGLTLARNQEFRSIPKIMLTGFPTYEAVRDAMRSLGGAPPPAVHFLSKQEGPAALLQAVADVFAHHVRINWNLTIRWMAGGSFLHLARLFEPTLDNSGLLDRAGEFEDLFRKLFFDYEQVTIDHFLLNRGEKAALEVHALSATGTQAQFIVVCGHKAAIAAENANYALVAPLKSGSFTTIQIETAETLHYAATSYQTAGGDLDELMPFAAFYVRRPTADVLAAVEHLYTFSLAPLHRHRRFNVEPADLERDNRDWFGLQEGPWVTDELERRAEAICQSAQATGLARLDYTATHLTLHRQDGSLIFYPNPVAGLHTEQLHLDAPILGGLTHGRIDASTWLVDSEAHTWLIDFAEVAPAPLLRDFLSLEIAVRFDLLDSVDLFVRHELEQRLLAPSDLNAPFSSQMLPADLAKPLRTIAHIRQLAAGVAGPHLEPYFGGLLFYALDRVNSFERDAPYRKRELASFAHTLLLAAILCEWLANSAHASAQLPAQALYSLWIDDSNKQVWVEGREVTLTPQEFAMLVYLYNNRGQLCSRQALVEALGETYRDASAETSRLNSAISRLRQKVEVDPEQPRHLITVRGYGYKLEL